MFFCIGISPRSYKYVESHTHECCELILNIEGEGTIRIGERELPFFPGSIHIVPKNTPHIKRSTSGFKDIYLLADTLSSILPSDTNDVSVDICDDEGKSLESLLRIMLYRYLSKNKYDNVLESMYSLVLEIIKEKCITPKKDSCVEALSAKLALSFNDPELSLSDVLESVGYCKDHVRRRFISQMGVTPGQYLTYLRIEHAKKLLPRQKELCLQIGDIGMLCGYYDQRYFCKIFKRETGMTPSEYAESVL